MIKEFNFKTGALTDRPDAIVAPETQTEIDARVNAAALNALRLIDAKSIRAIREYIAAKADAPTFLKEQEAAAQLERARLKP